MFSKKKKADSGSFILPDDQGDPDKRDTYRYVFHETRPMVVSFLGQQVELIDISAGGLAFKNQGFKTYDADRISLVFEMPNFTGDPRFTAWTRILHISGNGICHCIFEDCRVEEYELVHKFVLEMQKRDLSLSRRGR